jgi:hypothetical protein
MTGPAARRSARTCRSSRAEIAIKLVGGSWPACATRSAVRPAACRTPRRSGDRLCCRVRPCPTERKSSSECGTDECGRTRHRRDLRRCLRINSTSDTAGRRSSAFAREDSGRRAVLPSSWTASRRVMARYVSTPRPLRDARPESPTRERSRSTCPRGTDTSLASTSTCASPPRRDTRHSAPTRSPRVDAIALAGPGLRPVVTWLVESRRSRDAVR